MISLLAVCTLSLTSLQKPTMTPNLCCPRLGLTTYMLSLMFGVLSLLLYSILCFTLMMLLSVLLWFGLTVLWCWSTPSFGGFTPRPLVPTCSCIVVNRLSSLSCWIRNCTRCSVIVLSSVSKSSSLFLINLKIML